MRICRRRRFIYGAYWRSNDNRRATPGEPNPRGNPQKFFVNRSRASGPAAFLAAARMTRRGAPADECLPPGFFYTVSFTTTAPARYIYKSGRPDPDATHHTYSARAALPPHGAADPDTCNALNCYFCPCIARVLRLVILVGTTGLLVDNLWMDCGIAFLPFWHLWITRYFIHRLSTALTRCYI